MKTNIENAKQNWANLLRKFFKSYYPRTEILQKINKLGLWKTGEIRRQYCPKNPLEYFDYDKKFQNCPIYFYNSSFIFFQSVTNFSSFFKLPKWAKYTIILNIMNKKKFKYSMFSLTKGMYLSSPNNIH